MGTSHAVAWGPDSPTPAQLKEFFAQIVSGRMTRQRMQAILEGKEFPTLDLSGILPDGWPVVCEFAPAILTSPSELEGVSFHRDDETVVIGKEMVRRAGPEPEANLGFADLKLCYERRSQIPVSLNGKNVVFSAAFVPGEAEQIVFCLYCKGEQSKAHPVYLNDGYRREYVLGRRRMPAVKE